MLLQRNPQLCKTQCVIATNCRQLFGAGGAQRYLVPAATQGLRQAASLTPVVASTPREGRTDATPGPLPQQRPRGPLCTSPPAQPHHPHTLRSPRFSCCRSRICVFSWDRSRCGRSRDGSGRSAAAPGPCGDTPVGPAAPPLAGPPARRPLSPSRSPPRPPPSWRPHAGAGRRTGR